MKKILVIIFFVNCVILYAQNAKSDTFNTVTYIEQELQYTPKKTEVSKIVKLTYPIEEYEAMIIRCNELADKLIRLKKRIQNESMTKTQIKGLKKDMIEIKLLRYKLEDYTDIYNSQNYPFSEYLGKEVLDSYRDLSEALAKTSF